MSEQKQVTSSNRGLLIGAAAAIAVAGFGGYQVGFSSGEKGLVELQSQVGELQAATSTSAAEIETQAEALRTQDEELKSKAAELKAQAAELLTRAQQLETLQAEVSDKGTELESLSEQLRSAGNELSGANRKLAGLTTKLDQTEQANSDYLKTILTDMGKQDFALHVGGRHRTLIENKAAVGLSFVSREKRMARVTLSGEQMMLHLQDPERITLEGKRCELTLANLVSDTAAVFELECDT